jgi:YidC/Oxa1 family membrane protein insertase
MDRNTFTGLFLIMLILVGSFFLLKPSDAEVKKERAKEHLDSLKKAGLVKTNAPNAAKFDTTKKVSNAVTDSAILKTPFGAATAGVDQLVTLENKDLLIKLSAKGGRVYSVQLKDFKTWDKKPLILFDGANNHFGFTFNAAGKKINTDEFYFKPSAANLTVSGKDSSSVTMRLSYSPTQYIDYIYSLKGEGYKVGLTIKQTGLDGVMDNSNTLNLNWTASPLKQEKDMNQERQYSSIYFNNLDGDNNDVGDTKDQDKSFPDVKTQWISFKQHFFSSDLISKDGFQQS